MIEDRAAMSLRLDARVRLFDELAIGAERLYHLVIALEAELAPDIATRLARGEASVVRDDHHDRQFVSNRGIHLSSCRRSRFQSLAHLACLP